MSDEIRIEATREMTVNIPAGVSLITSAQLPDRETGENRGWIKVRAVADTEGQARDLIALTFERLACAFTAPFDAELPPAAGEAK